TLLCRKNMHRLLRTLPKPVRLVEALDSNENFASQSALMSLPCGFQTSLETVPAPIPYLHPEPGLVAKWAGRIGTEGFRIGIGWHGNKLIDLQRSEGHCTREPETESLALFVVRRGKAFAAHGAEFAGEL
ncbi:MAG TPA: hypothetical protein VN890_08100, partial [Methylocella sp.]|nr:hypothetical protein [Methylocella sp.]